MPKKITYISIVTYSLIIRLFFICFYILGAIWFVFKWSLAPLIFLINIIILLPIGKFLASSPTELDIECIEENDLPNYVWLWMEEESYRLQNNGYKKGQLVKIPNVSKDHTAYTLSLVHTENQLGVGLNYLECKKDKNNDMRVVDIAFAEFTLECPNGTMIDLSNQQHLIQHYIIDKRLRLNFPYITAYQLSWIAKQVSQKTNYHISKTTLKDLLTNLPSILITEANIELAYSQKHGYSKITADNKCLKLSWKGALQSALKTLWPTSAYYKHKLEKITQNFCTSLGIDLELLNTLDFETIKSASNQAITDIISLEKSLKIMHQTYPELAHYTPTHIAFFFNDDENICNVTINLERLEKYTERKYIASSQCSLVFYNEELSCEYEFHGVDFISEKTYENYKVKYRPILTDLKDLIPLNGALSIAKTHLPSPNMAVYEAYLNNDEDATICAWNIIFISKSKDLNLITIDAQNGKILKMFDTL